MKTRIQDFFKTGMNRALTQNSHWHAGKKRPKKFSVTLIQIHVQNASTCHRCDKTTPADKNSTRIKTESDAQNHAVLAHLVTKRKRKTDSFPY